MEGKQTPEQIYSEFQFPDLGAMTEDDFKRLIQQKITYFPNNSDEEDEEEEEEEVSLLIDSLALGGGGIAEGARQTQGRARQRAHRSDGPPPEVHRPAAAE